jgi:hypothetical protein
MQNYPVAYILEKLAMAQGSVAAGSSLVSQNPAGWLRRAIEEDYSPPRTFARQRQRHTREKKGVKIAQAEARDREVAEQALSVALSQSKTSPLKRVSAHKPLPLNTERTYQRTKNQRKQTRERIKLPGTKH